jgi:hypothetical protein
MRSQTVKRVFRSWLAKSELLMQRTQLVVGHVGDAAPFELDLAFVDRDEPDHALRKERLPRSRCADQPERFAATELQVDAVENA